MKKYQLEIRFPHHYQPEDAQQFYALDALDVESKFDAIQWPQQLLRQLQLESHDTSFVVKDTESQHELKLYLKSYAAEGDINFKLDSNIEIEKSHKDLFGLLTIKSKDMVNFPMLNLLQTRDYLSQFLSGYLLPMRDDFKLSQEKASKT